MEKINNLISMQREIAAKMVNANEEEMATLQREYDDNKRQIEILNQQSVAERNAPKPKAKSVVAQLREAIKNQERSITVQGYTTGSGEAAVTVDGVHDHVVPTEIKGILDPLYANSVLSGLGVRFFPGLPHGDVKVPVLSKNTVSWEGEINEASESQPGFSSITLSPKRLTAFVDISKQLIMQDTVGAEQAIINDLAKAVADKLEATIFGYGHGNNAPDGMFYNQTLGDANTFAKIVAIEGDLEDACVNLANCKYLLSPKAKATLRTMPTNGNGSPRVLANGDVDGTKALVSANVIDSNATAKGAYIYGDWSNLAVGSWGNVEIGIYDDSRTATAGVIRLVVNAYFDAKVLRADCFTYGDVRHA